MRAAGGIAQAGTAETVLSGIPLTGHRPMRRFWGSLFVDFGPATDGCQSRNRYPPSPGLNPCIELETRAGAWRCDANATGRTFSASRAIRD
jgi:hypothetical protein